MKNIKFLTSLIPAVCLAIFVSSCGPEEVASKKAEPSPMASQPNTFSLQKAKLTNTLTLPGELIANQEVDIYAKVNSFVKDLKVDVGSEVKAGQLLMVLEAPEISSQLAAARSKIKSLEATYLATRATYDRIVEASKTEGAISRDALDQITARKNSDLAQLEAAKAALQEIKVMESYLELRAPFSGVITARNVDNGAYVGPSGKGSELPLVTLQEQNKLRLVVSIPEANIPYVNPESKISFTVKSHLQGNFSAKVSRKSGALDHRLRSERLELDIPNSDKKLLPGMIAVVKIPLSLKDSTFVIPKSALMDTEEGTFVVKSINNSTEKVAVKKGREQDGKVEIFGSLNANDQLLSQASPQMK